MAGKKYPVTGDQYMVVDARMAEIKRQLRGKSGSSLDPELVAHALQRIVERDFREPAVEDDQRDSTFITHLSDNEAAAELDRLGHFGAGSGEAEQLVANWRKLAATLGHTGPVAWKVRAGFTLKQHAPKVGPCFEDFQYLQNWNFEDKPTEDSVVFWIPRLVPDSTNKTTDEQIARLAELREEYNLPESHLTDFGSASLIAGLILAEFKRSGDRVPLNQNYVRTSTRDSDDGRLGLGRFREGGLYCRYGWWGEGQVSGLGVFPLGVGH